MLCCVVLCCVVLCCVVLYCTLLYCTVLDCMGLCVIVCDCVWLCLIVCEKIRNKRITKEKKKYVICMSIRSISWEGEHVWYCTYSLFCCCWFGSKPVIVLGNWWNRLKNVLNEKYERKFLKLIHSARPRKMPLCEIFSEFSWLVLFHLLLFGFQAFHPDSRGEWKNNSRCLFLNGRARKKI